MTDTPLRIEQRRLANLLIQGCHRIDSNLHYYNLLHKNAANSYSRFSALSSFFFRDRDFLLQTESLIKSRTFDTVYPEGFPFDFWSESLGSTLHDLGLLQFSKKWNETREILDFKPNNIVIDDFRNDRVISKELFPKIVNRYLSANKQN